MVLEKNMLFGDRKKNICFFLWFENPKWHSDNKNTKRRFWAKKNAGVKNPSHVAVLSRRRRFTPNCRRYHRTKSLRPVIDGDNNFHYVVQCKIESMFTHTIFFKFKIWHAIGSFENRKISDIAYQTDWWVRSGADWVDTTSKVDSQNEKSKLCLVVPNASTALIFGLRRPHAVRGWF